MPARLPDLSTVSHEAGETHSFTITDTDAAVLSLVQGELDMMKKFGKEGREVVLSKVPYWML